MSNSSMYFSEEIASFSNTPEFQSESWLAAQKNYMSVSTNPNNIEAFHRTYSNRMLKIVGDFQLYHSIGQGNFSCVKYGIHTKTHCPVAVKTLRKNQVKDLSVITREIEAMRSLDHPNIVKLYDALETHNNFYLVMELCNGGELFHRIRRYGPLSELSALSVFYQLCSAVKHAHDHGWIHRDLKCENVMFDSKGRLKIVDWGLSCRYDINKRMKTHCGSVQYAAPELHLGKSYIGPELDVWSLGIIMFVMVNGTLPYGTNDSSADVKHAIFNQPLRFVKPVSNGIERFIRSILQIDVKNRPSIDMILSDPIFNARNSKELISIYDTIRTANQHNRNSFSAPPLGNFSITLPPNSYTPKNVQTYRYSNK
ncbi:Protein kinase, catalytic domain-containing protein [Rozella allomycis CSF55]|uniref:Protein kinase, catalytic domain-containing protein n=2 Tax=Rozella allomycis (strain CSF55) TaxID=988480 RepID=A0A075AUC5_ROZAC|nr:Protein kinase, catalytic domain-containing protein [Rozella allomycis CSF55]|eukprot:EPZ32087.1 Protein kinase, catalytic domain-containing protein [Rozella allomycis CSF55]